MAAQTVVTGLLAGVTLVPRDGTGTPGPTCGTQLDPEGLHTIDCKLTRKPAAVLTLIFVGLDSKSRMSMDSVSR